MVDEPETGFGRIVGTNDLVDDANVKYTVTNLSKGKEVLSGIATIEAMSSVEIGKIAISDEEKDFYLIEWEMGGKKYKNHYFSNIIDIDYNEYMNCITKCGMDEFEGFGV